MKYVCVFSPVFLLWTLLSGCSPVRYIGIETYNPARVNFSKEVRKVLVVNNAVDQRKVPFQSTVSKVGDTIQIDADSTTALFCRALGQQIAESPFFEDVLLLESAYRQDPYYYLDQPLTEKEVDQLCEEHQVDAVISLDRLLFKISEFAEASYGFEVAGLTQVEVSAWIRVYSPGQPFHPLDSVILFDTITPDHTQLYEELSWDLFFHPDRKMILRNVASMVGVESYSYFVPYWSEDIRWYYVSPGARWKEAASFAAADKWNQAAEIWGGLYTQSSSLPAKARLASNLALCHEIKGDYQQSLTYSTESYELLKSRFKNKDRYVELQRLYMDVIKHRLISDRKLKNQLQY